MSAPHRHRWNVKGAAPNGTARTCGRCGEQQVKVAGKWLRRASADELERHGRHIVQARKRLERATERVEAARLELEAAIHSAAAAGATLRPIAQASGLSIEWVRQILARAEG